ETVSKWYQINLAMGTATLVGTVAGGELVNGFAIAPPVVEFVSTSRLLVEGGGTARIVVRRTGDTTSTVAVSYSTADGTAVAGKDFTAVAGVVSFASGELYKAFSLPVVNDQVREAVEFAFVQLSTPTGATLGRRRIGLLTILDND